MRLLTLNIRFGAGSDFPERPGYDLPINADKLTAIAAAIHALRPDVTALQEVYNIEQAQRLAAMLGLRVVYARHPSGYAFDFFEWGLAFLHGFKTIRAVRQSIDFDADLRAGRLALGATLAVEGRPITFVNVHLAPRRPGRQIAALLSMVDVFAEPLVIMGDFNCPPDDPALDPMRGRWIDTCRALTSDGAREAESVGTLLGQQKRIDFIFVNDGSWIVDTVGLVPAAHRLVSDHLGYFTDVRLKGDESPVEGR